jgi:hypothetical protein
MNEKTPENNHNAEGFTPFSDEEITAVNSRIKTETSDPIVEKIVDHAFPPRVNSDKPNAQADAPQEAKDQPEKPGIKAQSDISQDRPQAGNPGKYNKFLGQVGKRVQIICQYSRASLEKRSIRYLLCIILALLAGLFLGWLLVPTPPPVIIP